MPAALAFQAQALQARMWDRTQSILQFTVIAPILSRISDDLGAYTKNCRKFLRIFIKIFELPRFRLQPQTSRSGRPSSLSL